MKVVGIVLACFGGALLAGCLNVAITKYKLNEPHDISKFAGGFAVSVLILIAGLVLIKKAKGR